MILSTLALSSMLSTALGSGAIGASIYGLLKGKQTGLSKTVMTVFRACNLAVQMDKDTKVYPSILKEEKVQDNETHIWIDLPAGLSREDLENKRHKFNHAVHGEVQIYNDEDLIRLEILTGNLPKILEWNHEILFRILDREKLLLYFGNSRRGPVVLDLAKLPHLLVGGETGGGKSGALRLILTELLLSHTPEELQMYLIDLKGGVELSMFSHLPNVTLVWEDTDAVITVLEEINQELTERLTLFRESSTTNIYEYRELGNRLPYMVVVFDEFRELNPDEGSKQKERGEMSEYDKRRRAHALTSRILAQARACGIHVIIGTQRPDASVLPGGLKANIPATLAFRVRNTINSKILLDSESAALLDKIPGRSILQIEDEQQLQVMFMTPEVTHELLH